MADEEKNIAFERKLSPGAELAQVQRVHCTRGFLETLYFKPRKWRFYISRYTVQKEFAHAVRESLLRPCIQLCALVQGLLYTWTDSLGTFFATFVIIKISVNTTNTICRSSKSITFPKIWRVWLKN